MGGQAVGKYFDDYEEGRKLAKLFIQMLRYNGGQADLGCIVLEMVEAGDRSGLVLGFMREIAAAAGLGMFIRDWLEKEKRTARRGRRMTARSRNLPETPAERLAAVEYHQHAGGKQ